MRAPRPAALVLMWFAAFACTARNPAYVDPSASDAGLAADLAVVPATVPPDAAGSVAATNDAAGERPSVTAGGALLVVGDLDLSASDIQLESSLTRLGFALQVKLDTATATSDAAGEAVVILSGSTSPQVVGNKFRDVTVPVVVFDAEMFPAMKMTGDQEGADFGIIAHQRSLAILDGTHPLAAGLTGTVDVAAGDFTISWGVPAASAMRIASLVDAPDRLTIFGYEAQAVMAGLPAPRRRVGSFVHFAHDTTYTDAGLALFAASVRWAAGL